MNSPSKQNSGTSRKREAVQPLPAELAQVALIDAKTSAAPGYVSLSWWLDGVRRTERGELADGEVPFPLPVIRQPRFTRWRLTDVRRFWIERAAACSAEPAERMTAQATKASAAAKRRRATLTASTI